MAEIVTCPSCGAQFLGARAECDDCGALLVAGPPLAPGADEVGYDLGDWSDDERRQLTVAMATAAIPSRWEGTEVVVDEAHADQVEELIDEIDTPDAIAEEEDDDDGGADLLSALYVAADVLQRDPEAAAAIVELLEAAEQASELGPPYGIAGDVWREVQRRTDTLADLLGEEGDEEAVMAAARDLREAVRPLV